MVKYDEISDCSDEVFRKKAGVSRGIFQQMIDVLKPVQDKKLAKGGRKPKMSLEDQLLVTLEYSNEYPTYAYLGMCHGVSESNLCRIIGWVINTLANDGTFLLQSKKGLLQNGPGEQSVFVNDLLKKQQN